MAPPKELPSLIFQISGGRRHCVGLVLFEYYEEVGCSMLDLGPWNRELSIKTAFRARYNFSYSFLFSTSAREFTAHFGQVIALSGIS